MPVANNKSQFLHRKSIRTNNFEVIYDGREMCQNAIQNFPFRNVLFLSCMTHAAYKLATVGIIAMPIAKVSCLNKML